MAAPKDDDQDTLSANAGKIIGVILSGVLGLTAIVSLAGMLGASSSGLMPILPLFALFLAINIGWAARTSDARVFFASGHAVPPLAGALSSLAAWFTLVPFLAMAGGLFGFGYDGLAFVLGPVAGLVIGGVLISPYLANAKAVTIAQFAGQRFGSLTQILVALISAIVAFAVFAAGLHMSATYGAFAFGLPYELCLWITLAMVLIAVLPGGPHGANWTGMAQALIAVLALSAVGAAAAYDLIGFVPAQVAIPSALKAITDLEFSMVEKGVASASSLKLYTKPSSSGSTFLLTVVTLALVTAAIPMLLNRPLSHPSRQISRSSSTWLIALAVYVALSAVAWSAFTKLALYKTVDQQIELEALPGWFEPLSKSGAVRIHGVSLQLIDRVSKAVQAGAKDIAAVSTALEASPVSTKSWAALKEPVRSEILNAALLMNSTATMPPDYAWLAMREYILPAAAKAAGNKTGHLTLQAIEIDRARAVAALPTMLGMSAAMVSLAIAGLMGIPLAIASGALTTAASALGRDLIEATAGEGRLTPHAPMITRLVILVLAGAGTLLTLRGIDFVGLSALALATAAAALLPMLIAAIWINRANAIGAIAGLVTGAGIAAYLGLHALGAAGGTIEAWQALAKQGAVILAVPVALAMTIIVSLASQLARPNSGAAEVDARGIAPPTEM